MKLKEKILGWVTVIINSEFNPLSSNSCSINNLPWYNDANVAPALTV